MSIPVAADGIPAHVLASPGYAVLLTPRGTGMSGFQGLALNRWQPDAVTDRSGFFFYLHDLDSGAVWSPTTAPAGAADAPVRLELMAATAVFRSVAHELEATLEITIAPDAPVELRRLTVRNRGRRERRLRITTWMELALNSPAADAAHPAFSRLFVQTAYDPQREALLAWRRLRSPEDVPLWAAHYLSGPGSPEYDTDRASFIGRGRGTSSPAAVRGSLGRRAGNVLDPGFALQRQLTLAPGDSVACRAVLAAGHERAAVEGLLDRFRSESAVARAFERATGADLSLAAAALGLPAIWQQRIALDISPRVLTVASPPVGSSSRPRAQQQRPVIPSAPDERLLFWNGHGGFTTAGDEYVIRVPVGGDGVVLPPVPWCNVIANEQAGCIVSESGAGYVWAANSRENRLTPWCNDPVSDPNVDAFFLRDDETGEFWSLTPAPTPRPGQYEVRHGFGYTRFRRSDRELSHELRVFMARTWPVRLSRVQVRNHGPRPRRLSLWSYAQLVLGGLPVETRGDVHTTFDSSRNALLAHNRFRGEYSRRVAFSAMRVEPPAPVSWSADRAGFIGAGGDLGSPQALREARLDAGRGVDPCCAHQCSFVLPPGAGLDAVILLGEGANAVEVAACLDALAGVPEADAEFDDVVRYWRELLGRVRVETPAPELDLLANGWAAYQTLSCRIWGRSALYQSGGAYGFRDQLQDATALVYLDPALARRQLLLHAAHQFVEGDVLHWWHPPLGKGIRTRFSDDLLWLPGLAAYYIAATGDTGLLDEVVGFRRARQLDAGEEETYLLPETAAERASFYQHCCLALDRSLAVGVHGLPLMGTGDWNDGMNRVGREGRGESVWLGFFLFDILHRFVPLCQDRGDSARAARYLEHRDALGHALNADGWDGEWYRRAWYDNGAPLGSASSEECRIDTIAQAWAVISGAAPVARAKRALDAMELHLVAEDQGIIRLLAPPFDGTPHDPGYIKGYLPGVRENGGQYTHGALWAVRALLELGRKQRGARLLRLLSPVSHGRTPDEVSRYLGEPYVIAADVYGVAPHVGRAGWTWYTGSAGWFFRVLLENLLGLQPCGGTELLLRPCIPDEWPGFDLDYTAPGGARYRIAVSRGQGSTSAMLDGRALDIRHGAVVIPILAPGEHRVTVELAADVGPVYRCRLAGQPTG